MPGSTSLCRGDPHTFWLYTTLAINGAHSTSLMGKKKCIWLASEPPNEGCCPTVFQGLYSSVQLRKRRIRLKPSCILWVWLLIWTCNGICVGAWLDTFTAQISQTQLAPGWVHATSSPTCQLVFHSFLSSMTHYGCSHPTKRPGIILYSFLLSPYIVAIINHLHLLNLPSPLPLCIHYVLLETSIAS